MRGVFLDLDSLAPGDLDLSGLEGCLEDWTLHPHTAPDQVADRLDGAAVVVSNKVPLGAAILREATDLKLICVAATGTNNVDLAAAATAGITVSNARDYATASVAEAVFGLMLTLVRNLDGYRARATDGTWSSSPHFCVFDQPIGELHGATLGIIGHGVLGRAVESLARAFSMRVLLCQHLHKAPEPGRVALDTLLAESDVISLHCPLSEYTQGLIGTAQLRAMKTSALLINTARGGIVDEHALLDALRQGHIAGAALDVLSLEPPAADNPLLNCRLPQLIVTPHVAWASRPARQRLVEELTANILAFRHGGRRNSVV